MPDAGGTRQPDLDAVVVILVTGPTDGALAHIGRRLVDERLAACVNVVPRMTSIYRWSDAVETAEESLGIVKSTRARVPRLRARLRELHPYELPELIVLDVTGGDEAYLDWVIDAVREGSRDGAT